MIPRQSEAKRRKEALIKEQHGKTIQEPKDEQLKKIVELLHSTNAFLAMLLVVVSTFFVFMVIRSCSPTTRPYISGIEQKLDRIEAAIKDSTKAEKEAK